MGYLSSWCSAIMDPKKHQGEGHMAKSPNRLSATEAVLRMAQKRLKARDLVEACLDRIEAREGQVHAWEALDVEGARKRADVLDKRSRPVGPLHGIPLAVIRAAYGHAAADPPRPGSQGAPRIGLLRTPWWDMAEPYNRKNIEEAARALRAAGAKVREWKAPDTWAGLMQAQHRIMTKEATQSYAKERARSAHLFSPIMQGAMADGDAVNRRQYADAKKRKRIALGQLDEAWEKFDLLLAPSAKGEAPSGLGNTGDPIFNRFWTLLGTPC